MANFSLYISDTNKHNYNAMFTAMLVLVALLALAHTTSVFCRHRPDDCRGMHEASVAMQRYADERARRFPLAHAYSIDETVRVDASAWPRDAWVKPENVVEFANIRAGRTCPVRCDVSRVPLRDAHVKIFLNSLQVRQTWLLPTHTAVALYSMESSGGGGRQYNAEVLRHTDLLVTYDEAADARLSYLSGALPMFERVALKQPPHVDNFAGVAAYSAVFVSNHCTGLRREYLRELAHVVPLASYGACDHTPELPRVPYGAAGKLAAAARYPFHLAFENTLLRDYTTEKFVHAFASGVVPVLFGDPDVGRWAPAPDSFVNAHDFASPEALGEHLRAVRGNATRYAAYFRWRRDPAALAYLRAVLPRAPPGDRAGACLLCMAYARRFGTACLRDDNSTCPRMRRYFP
jgi:hypothetical protein